MPRHRLPRPVAPAALAFLLAVLSLAPLAPLAAQTLPQAWNPSEGGAIELDRDWQFIWGQLLGPERQNDDAIAALAASTRPLNPSLRWNSHLAGYPDLPASGYGTYVLKVGLPERREALEACRLSLEIGKVSSASRVWWNGRLIGAFGTPGPSAATTESRMATAILDLPLPADPAVGAVWLVVEVANWSDNYPGMQAVPRIAAWQTLASARDLSIATTYLMAGLFLIMAVYHLFLFLFRPDERAPLYFAVICLLLTIRILVTDQFFVLVLLPNLPLAAIQAASYLTFTLLVASFAFFTTNLFRYPLSPVIRWGAVGGSLLYSIVVAVSPGIFYSRFLEIFQVFCLAVGLALAVLVVVAIAGRRQHAVLFFLGLFLVLAATVFDIVKTDLQWPYPSLVPVGMVAFVFVLALVLTRKSSQHLATAERLNHRLQGINNAMVRFVPRGFLQLEHRPNITDVALGDNSKDVVTALIARYRPPAAIEADPGASLERLNAFCAYMAPIIRKHGGTVIRFQADGLEAAFPGEVAQALDAALEMAGSLSEPGARLGIGLHHGAVLMATIGEPQHLEAAMLSDNVRIACGLADLCAGFGARILASGHTIQRLKRPEDYQFRVIGNFRPGGSPETRTVVELFESDGPESWRQKRESKKGFEYAVHLLLQGRTAEARQAFEHHLSKYPGDGMALWHLAHMTKLP